MIQIKRRTGLTRVKVVPGSLGYRGSGPGTRELGAPNWRRQAIGSERPGADKDVAAVVDAVNEAELARKVAKLTPVVCIKG